MATGSSFTTLDITIGQVENLNPQGQAQTGLNTGVTLDTADTGITLDSGGVIKGGQTAYHTGNGFFLGYSGSQYKVSIGDPNGEHIKWDGSNITISANTGEISGNLVVQGNLTVNGTTTTLNTQDLQVEDKNIVLNYGTGDTSASANGAGITIQDAVSSTTDATILWDASTDTFDFSHSVDISGNVIVSGTVDGRDVATDGTKLDGIESGATANQTASEIRTLVESATDSNVFTDADHTKLDGIEANATADQTASEIRTLVESATDSNVFTDADHTKLDGIESGATADQTGSEIKTALFNELDTNNLTDTLLSKLNAIEANADVTDTTNVTAAGALMDSELTDLAGVKGVTISTLQVKPSEGAFTDGDKTKLDGIEANATADQTASEIRTLVESATDSNVFTDADHTKLNGIEASADVTDTTNVVSALTAGTNITIASNGTISSKGAEVSDSAPSSPSNGALWFDSTNLKLYVYYNDGSSAQWVAV